MKSLLKKNDNELINRRRRKVKRMIFLVIFILTSLIALCYKLPIFNIKYIVVKNNSILSNDKVIESSKIVVGENIFFASFNKYEKNLLVNQYILKANLTRKLPNTVFIDIEERKATFFIISGEKYYIIDNNGIVFEERDNIEGFNLIELKGLDFKEFKIGKQFDDSKDSAKRILYINNLQSLLSRSKEKLEVSSVDLSEVLNFKVTLKNMSIYVGDGDNLKEKMNKAINTINDLGLKDEKGYINVGFDGTPVYYIEH